MKRKYLEYNIYCRHSFILETRLHVRMLWSFDVLVSLLFYIGTSYLMMYILAPRTFNLVVLGLA